MLDSFKSYWKNGKIQREVQMLDGILHGKTSNWDENGTQRTQHSYKYGKYHGLDIAWNLQGKKVFINTHLNGFYSGVEVGFSY